MKKRPQAKYDLAIATAEEDYKLAMQKCSALGGVDRLGCESAAEEILTKAHEDAAAKRDAALLAAE